MNVCRICFVAQTEKDISELHISRKTDSYEHIMLFCLNIKVTQNSYVSTKLCLKCYRKIISFYKFKSLALKNESHWQSLSCDVNFVLDVKTKDEINLEEYNNVNEIIDNDTHCEEPLNNSDSINDNKEQVKNEIEVKVECFQPIDSDDELLSVIKLVKDETALEDTKENEIKSATHIPVKRKYKLKVKQNNNNEKKDQICEECGKTVRNLREHMNQHLPADSRKKLKCSMCEKLFASSGARNKHFKTKHLGLKAHCKECNKDVVNLRSHLLVVHNSESLPFHCVPCGRRFISRSLLDHHMTLHSKLRAHQCDECDKAFRSKFIMMQHKRQVHDKEKTHLCQFCSKSFFKKYHLQEHLRTHSDEKPKIECTECGKFLSSHNSLKNHKLVHSDVKKYECNICCFRFSKVTYLTKHLLTHSKVKRYACKHCGWKFGRSDHCKRHEWSVHERNFLTANIDS